MRKMWLCTIDKDGQEVERQIFNSSEKSEQWFRNACEENNIDPDINPDELIIGKTLTYLGGTLYSYSDPDDAHITIFARQEFIE